MTVTCGAGGMTTLNVGVEDRCRLVAASPSNMCDGALSFIEGLFERTISPNDDDESSTGSEGVGFGNDGVVTTLRLIANCEGGAACGFMRCSCIDGIVIGWCEADGG